MEERSTKTLERDPAQTHFALPPLWRRCPKWAYTLLAVATLLAGVLVGIARSGPVLPSPDAPGISPAIAATTRSSTPTALTAASTSTMLPSALIPVTASVTADSGNSNGNSITVGQPIASVPVPATTVPTPLPSPIPTLPPSLTPSTTLPTKLPPTSLPPTARPVATVAPHIIQPLAPTPAQNRGGEMPDDKGNRGNGNGKEKGKD